MMKNTNQAKDLEKNLSIKDKKPEIKKINEHKKYRLIKIPKNDITKESPVDHIIFYSHKIDGKLMIEDLIDFYKLGARIINIELVGMINDAHFFAQANQYLSSAPKIIIQSLVLDKNQCLTDMDSSDIEEMIKFFNYFQIKDVTLMHIGRGKIDVEKISNALAETQVTEIELGGGNEQNNTIQINVEKLHEIINHSNQLQYFEFSQVNLKLKDINIFFYSLRYSRLVEIYLAQYIIRHGEPLRILAESIRLNNTLKKISLNISVNEIEQKENFFELLGSVISSPSNINLKLTFNASYQTAKKFKQFFMDAVRVLEREALPINVEELRGAVGSSTLSREASNEINQCYALIKSHNLRINQFFKTYNQYLAACSVFIIGAISEKYSQESSVFRFSKNKIFEINLLTMILSFIKPIINKKKLSQSKFEVYQPTENKRNYTGIIKNYLTNPFKKRWAVKKLSTLRNKLQKLSEKSVTEIIAHSVIEAEKDKSKYNFYNVHYHILIWKAFIYNNSPIKNIDRRQEFRLLLTYHLYNDYKKQFDFTINVTRYESELAKNIRICREKNSQNHLAFFKTKIMSSDTIMKTYNIKPNIYS